MLSIWNQSGDQKITGLSRSTVSTTFAFQIKACELNVIGLGLHG